MERSRVWSPVVEVCHAAGRLRPVPLRPRTLWERRPGPLLAHRLAGRPGQPPGPAPARRAAGEGSRPPRPASPVRPDEHQSRYACRRLEALGPADGGVGPAAAGPPAPLAPPPPAV